MFVVTNVSTTSIYYRFTDLFEVAHMRVTSTGLPDDNRELEPPDPFPNSEVKRFIANGSVRSPHVRVGHRQVSIQNAQLFELGVLLCSSKAPLRK